MSNFFRVAKSESGTQCPCCDGPREMWTVVWQEDDTDIEYHTAWADQEEAENLASYLNMAFEMGASATPSHHTPGGGA